MGANQHDLIVIGGGPAGYVAAIRAAQLGLKAACVEREKQLGGTCLRVGCIPSKALLESSQRFAELQHGLNEHGIRTTGVDLDLKAMLKRKDRIVSTLSAGVASLLKENGVTHFRGHGRLDGPGRVTVEHKADRTELTARFILIAAGSKSAELPGVELDGQRIGTSTEALAYDEVPGRLLVIGAGYIGLELGSVWNRLGSEVIVLEALDRILPGMDSELATAAKRILEKQGVQFRLGARVSRAYVENGSAAVECEGDEPIACDRILLAVGRVAATEGLGLETVGIKTDRRSEIPVGKDFRTSAEGVYAVGDCISGPKLAHKASHEAMACVEGIAGGFGHVNYDAVPAVCYTHPEMASVGRTEEQLQESGRSFRTGKFSFRASGRARTLGETEGLVKILADVQTDRVLGVHILGPRAGDLIAEAAAAVEFGASAEDLAHLCHAHPTLAESLGEAALDVAGRALHAPPPRRPAKAAR